MATYTSLTNPEDHRLYRDRAKNIDLIWCQQVGSIIDQLSKKRTYSLNDIGCNYGQLYKEIKRREISNIAYQGYDIDEKFLGIAHQHFPNVTGLFQKFDIETEEPSSADITVCSATFEHLDDPYPALRKMLTSTTEMMILRTFVGEREIRFVQTDPKLVATEYNINQFCLYRLSNEFFSLGFDFQCIEDNATKSRHYEVGLNSGVMRQTYIIVARRN